MNVARSFRQGSILAALFLWFVAQPASASLIYQSNAVFDSGSGLLWQSTAVTRGLAGAPIPDDRIVRDGWRLATGAEVEALFTGNFPQLAPVLNTSSPVTIIPEVRTLALALGGEAADLVIVIDGVEVLRWPYVSLMGWVALPTAATPGGGGVIGVPGGPAPDPHQWEYQQFGIGYAVFLDTFPDDHPDSIFMSNSRFVGHYRSLAAGGGGVTCNVGTGCVGDVGQDGYFLVRSAVPTPATALLFLAGLPVLLIARRRRIPT